MTTTAKNTAAMTTEIEYRAVGHAEEGQDEGYRGTSRKAAQISADQFVRYGYTSVRIEKRSVTWTATEWEVETR